MTAKLRLVFTITILFTSFWSYSQNNYWALVNRADTSSIDFIKQNDFSKSKVFSVDENMLKEQLKSLSEAPENKIKVYFPDQDGAVRAFYVGESSVLAPELAAKYPQIKSYSGYSVGDVKNKIRISVSHKEMQVMIVHPAKSETTFIQKTANNNYVVYARNGLSKKDEGFVCETKATISRNENVLTRRLVDSRVLRKYRLAVSASGEYTEFHGGNVADALAAINATVTRMNLVFENDLGLRFELIANNDQLIFTDGTSDPYSSGDSLNGETQTTITNTIGEANYDLGHLFHKASNNGNAGFIGAICSDGRKASAFSSAVTPEGDIFDIDFVAHEIGHQLGANHTWSFEPEGTGVQVEPGSGTTIMGYAGITGVNDVLLNSDDYFHYISIVQIIDNLEAKACGEIIALTNNPPAVNAIPNYIIPALTAFKLTGDATDPDTGNQLTYTWEQINDGIVTQSNFGPNNPAGANFRSLPPSADPSRYFPALARVVNGDLTQTTPPVNSAWETLTAVDRTLNFALTVRDNADGGGQLVSELVQVDIVSADGAFTVDSQSSGAVFTAGELLEVNWNVAGTNVAPINVQTVDILLSTDGGTTFSTLMAEQVLNDGTYNVVIPGSATSEARIMVRANGNIFFAVNAANFTIAESVIVLNPTQTTYEACQPDAITIPFIYETYNGFSEEVTFSVSNLPAGLSASFSPVTATSNNTQVNLTVGNTAAVASGNYTINLRATSASQTKELPLQLLLYGTDFSEVNLFNPVNQASDVSSQVNFEWEASQLYTSYEIQIAPDSGFANIVETATVFGTTFTPSNLQNNAAYFWRLKPINSCGEGTFGTTNSFTTIATSCIPPRVGSNLPIAISSSGTPTITSKVTFFDNLALTDIKVGLELDHTFLDDLVVTLTSPTGKSVILISNSCGTLDNINAIFDDDAENFVCSGNPAINGTVRPLVSFDSFLGDSIAGEWTLTVEDGANEDGGSLKNFYIEVCVEGEPLPDEDGDGVFDTDDICPGTLPGTAVDLSGCAVYRFASNNFELKTTSETCRTENDGILEIATQESLDYTVTISGNGVDVSDTFTTTYVLNNLGAGTYTVCFDAVDGARDYEKVCFEVVISEPEALSVSSRSGIDVNSLVLSLSGSESYTIIVNESEVQTTNSEFTITLRPGNNTVKVTGSLVCQGSYEKQFFIANGILAYPNPTTDYVNLFVEDGGVVTMSLFTIEGRLIRTEKRTFNGVETKLDVSTLSAGTYLLKLMSESQNKTYKIIKR